MTLLAASSRHFKCLLFACRRYARQFQNFLAPATTRCFALGANGGNVVVSDPDDTEGGSTTMVDWDALDLFVVVYFRSPERVSAADDFWQHTGYGISSSISLNSVFSNAWWITKTLELVPLAPSSNEASVLSRSQIWRENILDYWQWALEESRHFKKRVLEQIAALASSPEITVKERDVYLFPSGIAAITEVGHALEGIMPEGIVVFLGFPYPDTVNTMTKILGRQVCTIEEPDWGAILDIECMLKSKKIASIAAIFVELPGDPILHTPDMTALRRLADKYHFPVIIDDTIGTSVNMDVLRFADIVCTSLGKLFTGTCNVMGGSVVINPKSEHGLRFTNELSSVFIDTICPLDYCLLSVGSIGFAARVKTASANALLVAQQLLEHRTVAKVFYPRFNKTLANYKKCMRSKAGYGYLLSVGFCELDQAVAFFNSFGLAKGPCLGTEFTVASIWVLYGHPDDLDHDLSSSDSDIMIRISVGIEDYDSYLKPAVASALNAAQRWSVP